MATLNAFKKRGRKKPANPLLALKKKMQTEGFSEGREVIFHSSGEEKMSEVLLEFIKPYVDHADTEDAYRKLLVIAILAWNAAILPKEKRQEIVNKLLEEMRIPEAKEFRSIIEILIERKLKHFAENKRLIVNYELTDLGDGRHLSVASTLGRDEESGLSARAAT